MTPNTDDYIDLSKWHSLDWEGFNLVTLEMMEEELALELRDRKDARPTTEKEY